MLGASNVWLVLPDLAEFVALRARERETSVVHLHVASGMGRSWGMECGALGMTRPPLSAPYIYDALARQIDATDPVRRFALLTDVGNDIVYGASAQRILEWLDRSLERLRSIGVSPAIARLPLEAIESLSPLRFQIIRRLLFPGRPLEFETVLERSRALDHGLVDLARRHDAQLLETEGRWYGFDPIHPRRALLPGIFADWIDRLRVGCALGPPARVRLPTLARLRLRLLSPERPGRSAPGEPRVLAVDERVRLHAH